MLPSTRNARRALTLAARTAAANAPADRAALDGALAAAASAGAQGVERLRRFVRFETVSADAAKSEELRRCAAWLCRLLRSIGLQQVRVLSGAPHPRVYGAWTSAPGRPTVLLYGHYDVHPAGAPQAWQRPPFAGQLAGGRLHGRGASDDKGQIVCHLQALAAWFRAAGRLPVNVKCLFDGAEEIGSPGGSAFLTRHASLLHADVAVISDTTMPAPDVPAIVVGLRGALRLQVNVTRSGSPLHAGHFGGVVPNPLQALCGLLGSLATPLGVPKGPLGETAARDVVPTRRRRRSHVERTAIVLTRVDGGGSGSAIPARASADLDIRLAPGQCPSIAERLVRRDLAQSLPPGLVLRIATRSRVAPFTADPEQPAFRAARWALRESFGTHPLLIRSGGTIPVASLLSGRGTPVMLIGFGSREDAIHAPNESFSLDNLARGTGCAVRLLWAIGSHSVGLGNQI